ncbi:MAG TPA: ubiquinol-cytochrome C chaperone family protein [Sphingomicrobium sp.]|jgi:cytochrome b pre-mRNA-processing protein 3|nr:ubiquinol-cytochrome C chaperone family protein [Sphingomicrobium sp.]
MLDFLFRRLTAEPPRGAALFNAVTHTARAPHWYVEGKVPDTLDGRFAVLATVTALVLVRLEADGENGDRVSVALTERFIEVMESEHRELGLGDPALGKKVRKLVGSLARRTDRWREAVSGDADWPSVARASLYSAGVSPDALEHSTAALGRLWTRLGQAELADLEQGNLA